PFQYYIDDKCFVFASEIKAILQHPSVKTAPNLAYCKDYIKKGATEYLSHTAFENIVRFPHASYAETTIEALHKEGLKPIKYWEIKHSNKQETFNNESLQRYSKEY